MAAERDSAGYGPQTGEHVSAGEIKVGSVAAAVDVVGVDQIGGTAVALP